MNLRTVLKAFTTRDAHREDKLTKRGQERAYLAKMRKEVHAQRRFKPTERTDRTRLYLPVRHARFDDTTNKED